MTWKKIAPTCPEAGALSVKAGEPLRCDAAKVEGNQKPVSQCPEEETLFFPAARRGDHRLPENDDFPRFAFDLPHEVHVFHDRDLAEPSEDPETGGPDEDRLIPVGDPRQARAQVGHRFDDPEGRPRGIDAQIEGAADAAFIAHRFGNPFKGGGWQNGVGMEEEQYIAGGDCRAPVELSAPAFFGEELLHGVVPYRRNGFPFRLSIDHDDLRGLPTPPKADDVDRSVDDGRFAKHGNDHGDATLQVLQGNPLTHGEK